MRNQSGVSLAALSRLVHYSKGYLSKIENGEKPATGDVARRCDEALRAGGALMRLVPRPSSGRRAGGSRAGAQPGQADDVCPYQGLTSFGPGDARWFFGRERATASLVQRVAERLDAGGPLMVVAPSGAGKSSVLRAGLVPALRCGALPGSQHWPVVVLTPTARPLHELAARLGAAVGREMPLAATGDTASLVREVREALRSGGPERDSAGDRLVLVVDQFEELFTACHDEAERDAFVEALCALAGRAPDIDAARGAASAAARDAVPDTTSGAATDAATRPRAVGDDAGGGDGGDGRDHGGASEFPNGVRSTQGVTREVRDARHAQDARGRRGWPRAGDTDPAAPTAAVVFGVRADFCGHCLTYPRLVPALSEGLFALQVMSPSELREAIVNPATAAGLTLEAGLVEILLRDLGVGTGSEPRPWAGSGTGPGAGRCAPGVLPLLSHALLATWQQRRGTVLTVAGYELTGGLHGAVTTTAERVYSALDADGRRTARRLLLRLVQISEDAGETGRRVARTELVEHFQDVAGASAVVDVFVRARLLTADADTIEISHEALLRAWPRLRGWIAADRAGLLVHQQLAEAARAWEREGRDPAALYRGTRLAAAREWATDQDHRADLGEQEAAFLSASEEQQTREAAAARRHARRRRRLVAALAVLLTLSLGAGALALQQWRSAVEQRRDVLAHALAARSVRLAAGQPEASLLLAREAFRLRRDAETRGALLSTQGQAFAGRLGAGAAPVNAVVYSPDGHTLAAGSGDGAVRLWDTRTMSVTATLRATTQPVATVVFGPDGRTLAAGSRDGAVRVWRVRQPGSSPEPIATWTGFGRGRVAVAFSPDGRTVAAGGTVDPGHTVNAGGTVDAGGAGGTAGAAGTAGAVRLWSVDGGAASPKWRTAGPVKAVAFSPDGHTLAAGGSDGAVHLWDTRTRKTVRELENASLVNAVAFSADGRTLATGGDDRTVKLWDVRRGKRTATLAAHSDDVNGLAFHPREDTLASAGGDGTVKLWDASTHTAITTLSGHSDYVLAVAFSPDGRTLATGSFDHTVALWSLAGSSLTGGASVSAVAFGPDGRTVATAGNDGVARLSRPSGPGDGAQVRLAGHRGRLRGVAFSPDGRTLATAGDDHTARLWDARTHRHIATLTGHRGTVFAVAFSPDGRTLATASDDHTARLWDARTHRHIATLTGHGDYVNGVAFSPDGRTLATASDDHTARLWDVHTHRHIATLTGHTGAVWGVAFSPDGRTLATAGNDRTALLWDMTGRRPRRAGVLTAHTGAVRSLAFSPDGRTLATGSFDHTLRLWDTEVRRLVATVSGHADAVWSVAFSLDGGRVATVGADGGVRMWDPDVNDAAARACHLLGDVGRARWRQLVPDLPYRGSCDRRP